jgi:hypothetical protein
MSGTHGSHGHDEHEHGGDAHEEHSHDEHGSEEHGHGDEAHEEHGHEEHSHDEHGSEEHGHGDEAHEEHGHEEHGHEEHSHESHEAKHENSQTKKAKNQKPSIKRKKLRELNFIIIIAIAIVWRIALEPLPSVEPIIPLAVFVGLVYGSESGIILGLLSYPLSNIFMEGGLFGFWTIIQSISGAISGGITSLATEISANSLIYYTFIGTLIFEILINIPDGALIIWPYSIIHIISNIVFAMILSIFLPKQ